MKRYIKLIFTILIFSTTLVSCGKDDEASAPKKELVSKSWKVNQVLINTSPDNSTNYSAYNYQFNSDGTYIIDKGNGTLETGTWELNSTETALILDRGTSSEETVNLFNLSEGEMIIEFIIPATWKEGEKIMRVVLKA